MTDPRAAGRIITDPTCVSAGNGKVTVELKHSAGQPPPEELNEGVVQVNTPGLTSVSVSVCVSE